MRGNTVPHLRLIDRAEFEGFLQLLALIGAAGLGLWLLIAGLGLVFRTAVVDVGRVVPFLLATLTLLTPSIAYPEIRQWPYRHLSAAQRLGLEVRGGDDTSF